MFPGVFNLRLAEEIRFFLFLVFIVRLTCLDLKFKVIPATSCVKVCDS